jgi:hypothetical protein
MIIRVFLLFFSPDKERSLLHKSLCTD